MTLAINRQAAVSSEPVYTAVPPAADSHSEPQGGFQEHLNNSLQEDEGAPQSEVRAIASGNTQRPPEKADKKKKFADDVVVTANSQNPSPSAEPLLIHLPTGSIVRLEAPAENEKSSPNQEHHSAALLVGTATDVVRPRAALAETGNVKTNRQPLTVEDLDARPGGLRYELAAAAQPEPAPQKSDVKPAVSPAKTSADRVEALPTPVPEVHEPDTKPPAAAMPHGAAGKTGSDPNNGLAFAARVRPVSATAQTDTATARPFGMTSKTGGMAKAATEDKVTETQIASGPAPAASLSKVHAYNTPPSLEAAPAAEQRVENTPAAGKIEVPVETRPKSVTPLKDLSVQVGQVADQKVEVRLAERGGELHVTVRTADTDLAHELRQGIPEVVGRLSENGFKTETWHPAGSVSAVSAAAETASSSSDFQRHDPQGHGGAQHQQEQQQRGQQNTNRPKWLEELEGRVPNRERGESHGFSN